MSILKHCPFCGSEDRVVVFNQPSGYISCYCGICDIDGPLRGSKEEAILAWNKRPLEQELSWIVKKAEYRVALKLLHKVLNCGNDRDKQLEVIDEFLGGVLEENNKELIK